MSTLLLIFATALVLAMGATPVMRRLAWRSGFLDQPGARKIHARPVPRLGGVAIFAAFLCALVLFADQFYVSQMISIVVGATWVSFLGLWDDRVGLRASMKLAGQILGVAFLIVSGVSVELGPLPPVNWAITLLWVVGITNAMNLLDNMDGLSSGVAAIAAGFFLLLAVLNGQYLVSALSAALLGASLGFLLYNFNPASIFMGDTGSLFIGFVLAAVGVKLRFLGHPLGETWFIPILVLGLPVFDTTLVFVSRLRRGRNPLTTPGTDHVSHRLVARGLTRREAVLALYLVAASLGAVALFCAQAGGVGIFAAAGAALVGALALVKLEFYP